MSMSVLLVLPLANFAHGSSRVNELHFKAINFAKAIKGKCQLSNSDRFVGHVNFTQEDGSVIQRLQVKIF